MLRLAVVALVLSLAPATAYADPQGMCGIEDASNTRTPCPPYVTYDEEGREVGGSHRS